MPVNIRVDSAGVAQSNTPETDAMPMVDHLVNGHYIDSDDQWCVRISARDPGDAIDRVNAMTLADFEVLPKVEADRASRETHTRPTAT